MEAVVYAKRHEYYQAIEASRAKDNSGMFIEYTLAALYTSVLEQISVPNEPINEPINENEKRVLNYLGENPQATKEMTAKAVDLSRSSVTRHIQSLTNKGFLQRIGLNKTGYWKINLNSK